MNVVFSDFNQICAYNCGNAVLSPGWIHPRRNLSTSVLIVGQKGKAEIIVGNRILEIAPGRVAILPAGIMHYGKQKIKESVSYFWIHFGSATPPQLSVENSGTGLTTDGNIPSCKMVLPVNFCIPNSQSFQQAFHTLLYEQECSSPCSSVKYQLLFKLLLVNLVEATLAEKTGNFVKYSDITYQVIKKISLHLVVPDLSVKTIASELSMNADYVGRKFKEGTGTSIGNFILKKRIQMAICRLEETRDTVEKIAVDCGFGSLRQFLRQFKAQMGITPSELRLRYQMMHINSE